MSDIIVCLRILLLFIFASVLRLGRNAAVGLVSQWRVDALHGSARAGHFGRLSAGSKKLELSDEYQLQVGQISAELISHVERGLFQLSSGSGPPTQTCGTDDVAT